MDYITLTKQNIAAEHICCAISDKKCAESYESKKRWLEAEFDKGYVFRRLDARAKVFIEYGPAENAWVPVTAPNHLMIGCFWVSGRYKGNGHGKALLQHVIDDARRQGKAGLVAVVGTKKFHFMSDGKWLLRQGFEVCESVPTGFSLLWLKFNDRADEPAFYTSVRRGNCSPAHGIVVYYSNRCPYSEYHVEVSLRETARKRGLSLTAIKLETVDQAQACPSPATIFSLYMDGEFVTTDVSACMDNRFDRIVGK